MPTSTAIARHLATAMLRGTWAVKDLAERGGHALGKQWRWLRPLSRRIAAAQDGGARPRRDALARFIELDPGFQRACARQSETGHAIQLSVGLQLRPVMSPCSGEPSRWGLPDLPSSGSLAEWLSLKPNELDWFADCQGRERHLPAGPLRHYRYRWVAKRSGGLRLIETPKSRLKVIQRFLLREILNKIPPHDAAHGFRRGRSIKSYVMPHVGQQIVVRIDLQDFFASISQARIVAVFLTAGYPEPVAILLAGLCINSVPVDIWEDSMIVSDSNDARRERNLRRPHLPQGAPTSPALANLCAYRLDCRLRGLAKSAGANYTRYADDLAFSGGEEFARSAQRFRIHAVTVAMEEGFRVHHRKTRIMRQSVRQHIAGVVLNAKPNVRRRDYDELKAVLHNCALFGAESQNRRSLIGFRAHLLGRIEHVRMLHPIRGESLRELFDSINW